MHINAFSGVEHVQIIEVLDKRGPDNRGSTVTGMATFTALARILSLKNYYNTKIAELGKNLIPQKFSAIYPAWAKTCVYIFHHHYSF